MGDFDNVDEVYLDGSQVVGYGGYQSVSKEIRDMSYGDCMWLWITKLGFSRGPLLLWRKFTMGWGV